MNVTVTTTYTLTGYPVLAQRFVVGPATESDLAARYVKDQLAQPAAADPTATETPGPTTEVRAAEDELDKVIAFIDTMPTWSNPSVVQAKTWLIEQLHAGSHRR